MELFTQLLTNGVINGSAYGLLGLSFGLILGTTGRFHLAYATTYTLTAYAAIKLVDDTGLPLPLGMVIGLAVGTLAGVLIERLVYRQLAAAGAGLLVIFVASVGLTIVGENAIRLGWGSSTIVLSGFPQRSISILGADFTALDIARVLTAWFFVAAVALFLRYTRQGRLINAVRVNPEMAQVVGVDPSGVYLLVFAIGSFLAGVLALYAAMKFAALPDMGIQPTFFAFVVAFMAAGGHPWQVALTGLLIGLIESLSGHTVFRAGPEWAPLVVFTVLIIYLALRPVRLQRLIRLVAG